MKNKTGTHEWAPNSFNIQLRNKPLVKFKDSVSAVLKKYEKVE